ncbi:hypothetical protein [Variovorax sp.]|uniref:hypothetical protein n=1 Tax=Variovorax sp. TaxID=1871043 RepID=UPI00403762EF
MKRRRHPQQELRPVYVRPALNRLEATAARDWCRAAYRGERHKPAPGDFDPLWLRLGMRANLIEARAGWVVSNPLYDRTLRAAPQHDPSLPGSGWLRALYQYGRHRDLAALPRTRRAVAERRERLRAAAPSTQSMSRPGDVPPQLDMFREAVLA